MHAKERGCGYTRPIVNGLYIHDGEKERERENRFIDTLKGKSGSKNPVNSTHFFFFLYFV